MTDDLPESRRAVAQSLDMTLDELVDDGHQLREWQQSATPAEIGEFKFAIRQELRRRRALMN